MGAFICKYTKPWFPMSGGSGKLKVVTKLHEVLGRYSMFSFRVALCRYLDILMQRDRGVSHTLDAERCGGYIRPGRFQIIRYWIDLGALQHSPSLCTEPIWLKCWHFAPAPQQTLEQHSHFVRGSTSSHVAASLSKLSLWIRTVRVQPSRWRLGALGTLFPNQSRLLGFRLPHATFVGKR